MSEPIPSSDFGRSGSSPGSSPETEPLPGPANPRELFLAFTRLSLQGFGGLIAVIQRELVEELGWLTPEEFLTEWAVAQTLPGPNVINLAIIFGERRFGFAGAFAAVSGLLLAPLVLVLIIASVLHDSSSNPAVQGGLRGMGVIAAALVAGSGLRMLPLLRSNLMSFSVCATLAAATFIAVGLLRLPLTWTMLVLGGIGSMWAFVGARGNPR